MAASPPVRDYAMFDAELSGAVMNPKGIEELMPDYRQQGFPIEQTCDRAYFWQFFRNFTLKLPSLFTPPFFQPIRACTLGNRL